MAKHWTPVPSFKTVLTIIVVVIYTITLTSLFVSIIARGFDFPFPEDAVKEHFECCCCELLNLTRRETRLGPKYIRTLMAEELVSWAAKELDNLPTTVYSRKLACLHKI